MPHSVLIVDDSPTAAPELRQLLEREGYQVFTALRAEEALDQLRTTKMGLVISEALLPTMDGFEFVRQVRQGPSNPHVPIIMLTVRSAPEDYAAAFEAGANEYFLKPMEPPKMLAAVRGLIARAEAGRLEAPRVGGSTGLPSRVDRGRVITVFSPKGGVGKTTIAVNLAVAIKQAEPSARVGLIDLALEEGHLAMLLDVVPTSTIVEWAREDLNGATPHMLNQYFVQHRSGVALLAAPHHPEQAEIVRPNVVRLTLQLAPQAFDYVVVDTASTFGESSLIALEMAEIVLLPVTADMASLKAATNTMRVLDAVKIKHEKVRPVLNEIIPRAGLSREQVESSLGKDVIALPHGGTAFVDAANEGVPLAMAEPLPTAVRGIVDLARSLCIPETSDVEGERVTPVSILTGRLQERFRGLRRA